MGVPITSTATYSPRTPRRPKTPGEETPRQVHFEKQSLPGNTIQPASNNNNSNRPGESSNIPISIPTQTRSNSSTRDEAQPVPSTNFPQVGLAPTGDSTKGTWHTFADPTRSLEQQTWHQHWPAGSNAHPFPVPPHPFQHHLPPHPSFHPNFNNPQFPTSGSPGPPVTYIGLQHQPGPANMAGDYSNTAPPPTGVNFQPPVPDTTFGPMNHVYYPRFDNGFFPGVQVCVFPLQMRLYSLFLLPGTYS